MDLCVYCDREAIVSAGGRHLCAKHHDLAVMIGRLTKECKAVSVAAIRKSLGFFTSRYAFRLDELSELFFQVYAAEGCLPSFLDMADMELIGRDRPGGDQIPGHNRRLGAIQPRLLD